MKLCVCPATSLTPLRSHASTISSASRMFSAIGFSTTTCLPWFAASTVIGPWKRLGVDIHTASTSGSLHSASALS